MQKTIVMYQHPCARPRGEHCTMVNTWHANIINDPANEGLLIDCDENRELLNQAARGAETLCQCSLSTVCVEWWVFDFGDIILLCA